MACMFKTLTIISLLLFGAINIYSQTYRVSSSKGSDTNDGSNKKPWKTIGHAVKYLSLNVKKGADITLLMDDGDYLVDEEVSLMNQIDKRNFVVKARHPGKVKIRGDYAITLIEDTCCIKQIRLSNIDLGVPIGEKNRLDLYHNHKKQQLSAWPNDTCLMIGEPLGKTEVRPGVKKEPVFGYTNRHIEGLSQQKDLYIHGYWYADWIDEYAWVEEIDTTERIISLNTNFSFGFNKNGTYRFLNALTELDEPGEFYVDRIDSVLYWYPDKGYNPKKDELTITSLRSEQMMKLYKTKNIIFDGICFMGGRNDCISIQDCENITFRNCRFSEFGGTGVKINNSGKVTIDGCLFQELGGWGINANVGKISSLEPANLVIRNNIFKQLSNYRDTYRQSIRIVGCGVLIANNTFVEHPSSAIRIDGNDVVVEYNRFEDIVKRSGDQGGLDMYKNYSYRGIIIRYNYWKNINGKKNVSAIRFDDKISGQQVYGNIFENCGSSYFGAIQIHGGNNNNIFKNIFLNCSAAISFDNWEPEVFLKAMESDSKDKNLGLFTTETYKQKYPDLHKPWNENINRNFIHDNFFVNIQDSIRRNGGESEVKDNRSLELSNKQTTSIPKLLKRYGARDIPFKKMGTMKNIYQQL